MRILRIAALTLLPLSAGCQLDRPNLRSTGGGYAAEAKASVTDGGTAAGRASGQAGQDPSRTRSPAVAPAGH